ncbi:DUF4297 family anti-phage-associated protein [Stenotrophomonas maltophilia]|jgi:hypothetical protein|uniref:DUF4297 family anti-phage-associated protein n=2 Tax=Stenotrophomonas maltophilia TaxID=40324 RepID=UPI0015DEF49C|nr:DUF4297 family anti-phage-associated protein [Stenotrophomonas maltophilia]MBA0239081.1 hypothetical protein [Stenotrophomonas maltophilia]
MLEVDKKREATASIRGYFYQLDAALLEILRAGLNDDIVIEGVEDFDRYTDEGVIYGQVKYYAEQNLTDSVLRDPLYKLFVHFHGLEEGQRAGRKYILYGHFSEVKIDIGELSVERFKSVMEYRKEVRAADGTITYEKKSLLNGSTAPDELIEAFCKNFSIKIAAEYSEHRNSVIEAIRKSQGVSVLEAEGFHYPIALDYIATLATKKDHNDRRTTRRDLQEVLKGAQVVHHRWLLREKEEVEYAKHMKRLYFSPTNGAGMVRAFIIQCDTGTDPSDICDQLRSIGKNWSSAKNRRIQNSDRYAPFILLRGADEEFILQVKNDLFDTGIIFVDGFPYRGSPFRIDHLHSLQTQQRQIEIRFVDDEVQLQTALDGMGRKSCHIYDFFLESPVTMDMPGPKSRLYSIPVSSISTIKKII